MKAAEEPTSPWQQYRLSLQAYNSNPQCRLIIKPIEPVTMYPQRHLDVPRAVGAGTAPAPGAAMPHRRRRRTEAERRRL